MTIRKRAVNDDQKQIRRQHILDEAWRLFGIQDYNAINIIDIAKGVGVAKGTIYLYFPTKEALFLAVVEQQFEAWFDEVEAAMPETLTAEALITLIHASLMARPMLPRLFAITPTILEHNLDYAAAVAYKQMLRERVLALGAMLETRLRFFRPGEGAEFLHRIYALSIGIESVARPAPIIQQALDTEPELALFRVSFSREFLDLTFALIQLYQHRSV